MNSRPLRRGMSGLRFWDRVRMTRLRRFDQTEMHGWGFPIRRQLERNATGGQQASPLAVPDFEYDTGPLHLRAVLPLVEIDPIAHRRNLIGPHQRYRSADVSDE